MLSSPSVHPFVPSVTAGHEYDYTGIFAAEPKHAPGGGRSTQPRPAMGYEGHDVTGMHGMMLVGCMHQPLRPGPAGYWVPEDCWIACAQTGSPSYVA